MYSAWHNGGRRREYIFASREKFSAWKQKLVIFASVLDNEFDCCIVNSFAPRERNESWYLKTRYVRVHVLIQKELLPASACSSDR